MICSQCKNRNPIGNKFCRECGEKLSAPQGALAEEEAARAEAERVAERAAGLLADAFALAEKNKPDEAIPLAENAAELLPESTSAYALLAALYERTDQEKRALEAQERVVALNPDSAADAEKLDQMRRGVHVLPRRVPEAKLREAVRSDADRDARPSWAPLVAAGLAGVLVLGAGFSYVGGQQKAVRSQNAPSALATQTGDPSGVTAQPTASNGVSMTPTVPGPPPPVVREDPFAPVGARPLGPSASNGAPAAAPSRTASGGVRALPAPAPRAASAAARRLAGGGGGGGGVAPAAVALPPLGGRNGATAPSGVISIPAGPPSANGGPSAPSFSGFGPGGPTTLGATQSGDPVINPAPSNSGGASNGATTGGYISIRVGPPPAASAPPPTAPRANNAPTPRGNNGNNGDSGGDPLTRAQNLQSAGRYRDAVGAYDQALASGGNTAEAHQGKALAHQRMGDDAAARASYKRAIASYEAQIAAGKNVSASQRGLASSKAGLEALGGG